MRSLFPVLAVALINSTVFALPDYEPFADATASGGTAYTAGSALVSQTNAQGSGWYQAGASLPTAAIQAGSLSYNGLASAGGNDVLVVPQSNVASRFALGSGVSSGSLYYSFLMQVPQIGTTMGTSGGFLAGFNNTGASSQTGSPTVIGARVLIRSATGGFNLGLSKASSSGTDFSFSSTVFTSSDTIMVVGAYDFGVLATQGDDSARMWLNPSSSTFGAATAPNADLTATTGNDAIITGALQSFLLYARANTLMPDQWVVDDLRVGTSWADVTTPVPEPTGWAFVGLGMIALLARGRWRR